VRQGFAKAAREPTLLNLPGSSVLQHDGAPVQDLRSYKFC
jgi:hypothetical protein